MLYCVNHDIDGQWYASQHLHLHREVLTASRIRPHHVQTSELHALAPRVKIIPTSWLLPPHAHLVAPSVTLAPQSSGSIPRWMVPRNIKITPCGTRTRNLRIRSPTPCPLGQGGHASGFHQLRSQGNVVLANLYGRFARIKAQKWYWVATVVLGSSCNGPARFWRSHSLTRLSSSLCFYRADLRRRRRANDSNKLLRYEGGS